MQNALILNYSITYFLIITTIFIEIYRYILKQILMGLIFESVEKILLLQAT